ncbi:MAG: ribonuclease HII [Candidatus Latescibacter sp.]|nr:ribonuclease HII [Candidatus Latescibacter sp.]
MIKEKMESSLAGKRLSLLSVTEIRKLLEGVAPDEALIAKLKHDSRAGVRNLACSFSARKEHNDCLEFKHAEMLTFECELRAGGISLIAGLDEAGRGPLAGPAAVGCVIFADDVHLPGLDDSKKMTAPNREEMYSRILDASRAWSVVVTDHREIDEFGVHVAVLRGMGKAVENLSVTPEIALVDGRSLPQLACPGRSIVHGDALSLTIAAASVLAKVTRDRIMVEMDSRYPGYGFAGHKGYGSSEHIEAVRKLGPCDIHRISFEIVSAVSPPGTVRTILEKRLWDATSPAVLECAANGIARNSRFISENDLDYLRSVYRECKNVKDSNKVTK